MKKISLYTATALVGISSLNLANAQSIDYDIMESIFGEKVTASATGKPQRVSDAPVDMIIIGQDEIAASGAKDIPQLLEKHAGVSVKRGMNNQAEVNVRGYNDAYSNRLLVLVNGRQVYQDYYGFTAWSFLPVQMSEIRQIEVVKGPNTSLFGLNAESGVINIITYSPLKDDINTVEASYGTQGTKEGVAIATVKPNDNFAFRVSAESKSSKMFGLNEDLSRDAGIKRHNGLVKNTYNLDSEYRIDDDTELRFQAGEVDGSSVDILPQLFLSDKASKEYKYAQATLLKNTDFGLSKVNLYHNRTSTDIAVSKLNVLQAENLFQVDNKNTFRVGAEYRNSNTQGILVSSNGQGYVKTDLVGVSGMWEHKATDKLTFTNSLRFDHVETEKSQDQSTGSALPEDKFDQNYDVLSFNTGAVYKLNQLESLRFNAGRGAHIPATTEFAGDYGITGIELAGNPDLDPEILWSAEAGYTKILPKIQGKAKATVFFQYIEDHLTKTIDPLTFAPAKNLEFLYSNGGTSKSVGLELALDGKYNENLGYGSSYTFMYTDDDADVADTMFNEDNNNEHKVAVWTDYNKDKLSAHVEAIWTSGVNYKVLANPTINALVEEKVHSYITLNTNVSYDITEKAEISLAGYNLLDEHQEFISNYNAPLSMASGGNELGRSALLKFKYKF